LQGVVVTGLGAITPLGNNADEYWRSLLDGVSGAADIVGFDAEGFRTQFACEIKNYDPLDHRSEEHTSELQSRLHLVCRLLLEKKQTYHTTRDVEYHTGELATTKD